jgi:hypothetical protein
VSVKSGDRRSTHASVCVCVRVYGERRCLQLCVHGGGGKAKGYVNVCLHVYMSASASVCV